MAVFSPVNKENLLSFLQKYDIGTLEKFEGILEGIENTNYKVTTSKNIFILTTLVDNWEKNYYLSKILCTPGKNFL